MAGDWIKMRGALLQSPKLIGAARRLHASQSFRDWLTPGGASANGQIVTDDALRCVTCALLMRVWSASREFGKFDGDDLILAHITLDDIDTMAGAPGVGRAMAEVGWAVEEAEPKQVRLPKFRQHNVPMSNADRQREYRSRKDGHNENVTKPLRACDNKPVTREEKRREENNTPLPPLQGELKCLDTDAFRAAWQEWVVFRKQKRSPLTPVGVRRQLTKLAKYGEAGAIASIIASMEQGYTGVFDPPIDKPKIAATPAPESDAERDARIRREREEEAAASARFKANGPVRIGDLLKDKQQ